MRIKRKRKRRIRAILLIAAALAVLTAGRKELKAETDSLPDRTLGIRYYADVDGQRPVVKAGFEITRIASLTEKGTYLLLIDLTDDLRVGTEADGVVLNKIDAAAAAKRAAGSAGRTAGNAGPSGDTRLAEGAGADGVIKRTGTTNAAGELEFTDLPSGLYLCVECDPAAGFRASSPLIVPIPCMTEREGAAQWQPDGEPTLIYPKPVKEEIKPTPVTAGSSPKGAASGVTGSRIVKTGDTSRAGFYLAEAAISLLIIVLILSRKWFPGRQPTSGRRMGGDL